MRIGIVGCAGRMGQMLMRQVLATAGCTLSGGTDREDHPKFGQDLGVLLGEAALGLNVTADAGTLFDGADAVIDFTTPAATLAHAGLAVKTGTVHVIGTTGLTPAQKAGLAGAGQSTRIVFAPNMSVGVNLAMALVEKVASVLDGDTDIEIVEMHHKHKVDAPSGTALGLGEAAAAGRTVALDEVAVKSRDGHTGAREKGTIGFATLRGGDVVGDHSVIFASEGERIEITHKASDRVIFARGAVRAALWAQDRPNGLYSMRDVLGI